MKIKVKVYKPYPLGKVLNKVKRMRLRCAYFYYLSCDTVTPSYDAYLAFISLYFSLLSKCYMNQSNSKISEKPARRA